MNDVSVVVPTVGRPELVRAVGSVRAQLNASAEIILVVDRSVGEFRLPVSVTDMVDRVLWTGGGRGAAAARNIGVEASGGSWVAFLDDDDSWMPQKLSLQLSLAESLSGMPVISTRYVHIANNSKKESRSLPLDVIKPGQDVAEYLFRTRRPAGGRSSLYTSTLLTGRPLARLVQWDERLRRHQDWDRLVRAGRLDTVTLHQLPQPLVRIQTGSVGSISAGNSWEQSLFWAESVLRPSTDTQTYVDFLAAQTLRYAVAARSRRGVSLVLAKIRAEGRSPSWGPVAIAAGGLLPRSAIERILRSVR